MTNDSFTSRYQDSFQRVFDYELGMRFIIAIISCIPKRLSSLKSQDDSHGQFPTESVH